MGSVRLVKNPFDRKNDLLFIDYGSNWKEIVDKIDLPESIKKKLAIYKLDENLDNPEIIPEDKWEETFPKDSEHYQIMMRIGGGGDGGGKTVLRMVAMVAIMAVAVWATAGAMAMAGGFSFSAGMGALTTAGQMVAYGVGSIVGGLIGNALVPPPALGNQNDLASNTKRTLSGSSNQANPYGAVPRIYGRTRFSPYKIAQDYTEMVGDDTYLRCLFCFGYGPLKISDIKIGTNSISNYSEVQYEIREGWEDDEPITLYSNTVITQNYSIKLYDAGKSTGPQIVTTLSNQNEAIVNVYFPALYQTRANSGKLDVNATSLIIKYRKANTEDEWTLVANPTYAYIAQSPFTKSFRIQFPEPGTYDISVHQNYALYNDDSKNPSSGYLQTVQNIEYEVPYRAKGLCIMALRIKATDQLNGTLDNLSALCESYEFVPTYEGGEEGGEEGGGSTGETVTSIFPQTIPLGGCDKLGSKLSKTIKEKTNKVLLKMNFPNGITTPAGISQTANCSYLLEWTLGNGEKQSKTLNFGLTQGAFTHEEELYVGEIKENLSFTITKTVDYGSYLRKRRGGSNMMFERVEGNNITISNCQITLDYDLIVVSEKPEVEDPDNPIKGKWKLNRHPAWHVYDILTGTAAVTKVDPSMIDIDSFIEWEKTYPDWLVDYAFDGDYTRLEAITSMCSAAKATFTQINGKYTIVLDKIGKTPVAAISPRNSFDFSFGKAFQDTIHGFKVKYIEPERDWTEQEVIVYAKGYDKTNATNFEALETFGCTDRARAWRFGKYMFAQAILRPETYTLSQDVENLAVNVGDLVLLSHDVLKVGIGSARVKDTFVNDDGRVTAIELDDKFYLPSGNTYSIVVRDTYGKLSTFAINSNEGEENVVVLTTAIPESFAPEYGNMIFIGITDRTVFKTIVTKIEPGDDLTATITLVPEAVEVHDESEEEIPPFDPGMTDTPEWVNKAPLSPIVENIIADERALIKDATGGYKAAVSFDVRTRPEETEKLSFIQVYTQKENDPTIYRDIFPYTGNDKIQTTHVDDGRKAHIKVRYISDKSVASEWTEFDVFVEGRTNPPPDVLNLDRQGYNITWNYDNKPLDFAGFRVYYNYGYDIWKEHAVRAHTESLWASPPFSTENLPREVLTLFVVAVDTAGNESKTPAIISFDNGDVEYDNVLWRYDFGANNFPGTIKNGFVFRNTLLANENQYFWKDDKSKFWKEDDEKFYDEISYSNAEYTFIIPYDGAIQNAYIKLDWDIEGVYKIYYMRENKEPFYPPLEDKFYKENTEDFFYAQTEWEYLMPDKLLIGNERVYVKIVFEQGNVQGKINKLIATIDAPDISEQIPYVNVSSEGTRIQTTKGFKVINKIYLTLMGGGKAVTPVIVDYNAELGPMIALLDSSLNRTDGVVNADVRGYK